MSKFNVHLYVTVRVTVVNVEAETPEAACKVAEENVDLYKLAGIVDGCAYEYAEETLSALVDHVGDIEYENSAVYTPDGDGWY